MLKMRSYDLGEKYIFTSVLIWELLTWDGDHAAARAEHGLAIASEIGHPWGIADALTNLGCVYRILGEYSTSNAYLEKSLRVYQEHGTSIWETDVLCALAENAIAQGDFSTARFRLQAATINLEISENKWLQTLVCYFRVCWRIMKGCVTATDWLVRRRRWRGKPIQARLARSLVALVE
jgi:ATP/maltotriose-dependent transcriptional regulator MalT